MTAIIEDAKEIVINKWGTLNTAASPQRLPDGHSPNLNNVWMDEKPGSVVTANGYRKLGEIPSGNPPTLVLNFFKTSDGSSQLIVSDNESVWHTTDYVNYTLIKSGLSQYFQLRAKVIRDKVWFTNGSDDVATWDGTTYTALNGTGGTPDVPVGKYIEYHDERVWIYGIASDLSACRFSALANSSGTEIAPDNASAWPIDNELQISEGDADQGTGIFLYRGYLYCSKQYSIWRITGYDEYTYTRTKTRASTGTRFQESIQIKDNLVHFIGVDGMYVFDGEEAKRISDIVDPASSDSGVFAFRNLQQPLLNSKFWNVSAASDFNAGTVPNNLSSGTELTLVPADDTEADFNTGTKTRVEAVAGAGSLGYLQLSRVASGGSATNLASGKTGSMTASATAVLGSASQLFDGTTAGQKLGFADTNDNNNKIWRVDLAAAYAVGRVVIKSFYFDRTDSGADYTSAVIEYSSDDSSWATAATFTVPTATVNFARQTVYSTYAGGGIGGFFVDETDIDTSFSTLSARYWRVRILGNKGVWAIAELQVYQAGYETDGKFISTSVDFGSAPASFGALAASITANGENYQFFTQSSDDNSTWDSEANLSNGAAITSTLRRYLRWGVYLYSSTGVNSPVIDKVYLGSTYISEIHDTGGNILLWAALQAPMNKAGQTINLYYRAASTSGGVSAASWTAIVPGAVPNTAVTNTFIQIRAEFSTTDATMAPYLEGFTVNWILSSASGASVLQNVASFVWLNRYWLAAATLNATENDVVIVLGKSSFESPWHKRDFKILSFCRFQDIFIGGSSEDGSLYQLETGYSKNSSAMDSYYETRDLSEDNFIIKGRELLVTADRSGPYNLYVGWSTDGGLTYTEKTIDLTRESGESLSFTTRLNISFMADRVRFRVRTNAADQPFSVDELRLYYRLTPQRGSLS